MEKEALLEVRSLSVRYPGNKKEVLHQVDLTLVPGAITCVIGESGSGKSTLLQAVLQLPARWRSPAETYLFAGRGCRRCGGKAAHHSRQWYRCCISGAGCVTESDP